MSLFSRVACHQRQKIFASLNFVDNPFLWRAQKKKIPTLKSFWSCMRNYRVLKFSTRLTYFLLINASYGCLAVLVSFCDPWTFPMLNRCTLVLIVFLHFEFSLDLLIFTEKYYSCDKSLPQINKTVHVNKKNNNNNKLRQNMWNWERTITSSVFNLILITLISNQNFN